MKRKNAKKKTEKRKQKKTYRPRSTELLNEAATQASFNRFVERSSQLNCNSDTARHPPAPNPGLAPGSLEHETEENGRTKEPTKYNY